MLENGVHKAKGFTKFAKRAICEYIFHKIRENGHLQNFCPVKISRYTVLSLQNVNGYDLPRGDWPFSTMCVLYGIFQGIHNMLR